MHAVYLACLFGGALATALFAALGSLGHAGGRTIHGHAAGHAPHGSLAASAHASHAHTSHGPRAGRSSSGFHWGGVLSWTLSVVNPVSVAAAALWFGGAGVIIDGVDSRVSFIGALAAAVVGAYLVWFVMRAFARASTEPLSARAEGAMGTVNATIRPDAPGEVIYTLEGLTRSLPARSESGATIPRGTAVAILRRERGMAVVTPLDPLESLVVSDAVVWGDGANGLKPDHS